MAGNASKENGKKGGRPKGSKANHTIVAEQGRAFVIAIIAKNLKPLIEAMVQKATKGDVHAFRELMDRGWGRPVQALEHSGKDGAPIPIEISEAIAKKNNIHA
jgi:hypothetical protein